jgi:ethanolaminephosphotransferase
MAPNTVTSIGLIWMITSYGFYWYYVPSLEILDEPPPRWIFLWNGISMLAYQTLDNMDGKQARRTQSSSPLGLLFDHGCDAINSIFGSVNWIIGMGLIPSEQLLECWILIFGPFLLFYISTWEQYYTGELILPIVNGPNEGLLGGAMLSLTSYWLGYSFWQGTEWYDQLQSTIPAVTEVLPPLRNRDVVIIAASIGFVQEALVKGYQVSKRYPGAFLSLLPLLVLSVCFAILGCFAPSVLLDLPRTSLHLTMILFVEMSTEIMLAHVTAQPFEWRRWHLLPLIGLTVWIVMVGTNNSALIQYWILAYTFGLGAYLVMKVVLVIHEICNVLGIWCFDIVTPHPNKQRVANGTKEE